MLFFLLRMPPKHQPFHPANRHQGSYDFARLTSASPSLSAFTGTNQHGTTTIDFADPIAVKALNTAILKADYQVAEWDIPDGQLCPPIPGRADYVHHLADLLRLSNQGKIPKKQHLTVLDIGTGASGIYPLIGVAEYGWRFVGVDINPDSLKNVQKILDANPRFAEKMTLRLQPDANAIFKHIFVDDDWFDLTMCNPPFHASLAEAQNGAQQKWRNLGKVVSADVNSPTLNFGGRDAELWCPGGELAFIEKMMLESAKIPGRCFWFSCLVSKSTNIPPLKMLLKRLKVQDQCEISMSQGSKQSRFLAWTFLTPPQQTAWKKLRW